MLPGPPPPGARTGPGSPRPWERHCRWRRLSSRPPPRPYLEVNGMVTPEVLMDDEEYKEVGVADLSDLGIA